MNKARKGADALRAEAKEHLNAMWHIHPPYTSKMAERFVDCVVLAAALEVIALQSEALSVKPDTEPPRTA